MYTAHSVRYTNALTLILQVASADRGMFGMLSATANRINQLIRWAQSKQTAMDTHTEDVTRNERTESQACGDEGKEGQLKLL